MSARVRVASQQPARGGDGRRLRWSESPIPRVGKRRVRTVGAVVPPVPVWYWEFNDADNSEGGPVMGGTSAPYNEHYVLGGDYTSGFAARAAGDWTYAGAGATIAAGESAWLYTSAAVQNDGAYFSYWTYSPGDATGWVASVTFDGLESTATATDLVEWIAGATGANAAEETLAAYRSGAALVSSITSVNGDLLLITDGVTLATVTDPTEPVSVVIRVDPDTGNVTITVNGATVVADDAAGWAVPTAVAVTGATGGTAFTSLKLYGTEIGSV